MIPRRISIDFAGVPLHWSRIPEYASTQNAGSPIATQSEIFVNAVMAKLRKALPADKAAFAREIDIFVRQETNHCNLHAAYNKELYARGYEGLKAVEAKMRTYYRDLLKNRSLSFNIAYCAGFENIALFQAKYAFISAPDLFDGGDERMVDLFKWHLAEEFEHRTVAHAAFAAVSGNYFMRIYGALVAFMSLNRFQKETLGIILAVDRATMTADEVEASKRRMKLLEKRMARYVMPRLLRILVPFYDPEKHDMPQTIKASLSKYQDMAVVIA